MKTVFPVINPSISIYSNGQPLTEEVKLGRGIAHYFKNTATNYNLTCFTSKKDKKWSTKDCSTNLIKTTGEI